jgi:hypothetical protein
MLRNIIRKPPPAPKAPPNPPSNGEDFAKCKFLMDFLQRTNFLNFQVISSLSFGEGWGEALCGDLGEAGLLFLKFC